MGQRAAPWPGLPQYMHRLFRSRNARVSALMGPRAAGVDGGRKAEPRLPPGRNFREWAAVGGCWACTRLRRAERWGCDAGVRRAE